MAQARNDERGFTMVEMMVSTALAALSAGFIFGIHSRLSVVQRNAGALTESQQVLRAGLDYIARDLRNAGYGTSTFRTAVSNPANTDLRAVAVDNNAYNAGPDVLRIYYADSTVMAPVSRTGPLFDPAVSQLANVTNIQVGDILVATRMANPNQGAGCVLKVTAVDLVNSKIRHESSGAPWNTTTNTQCSVVAANWTDGFTVFMRFVGRSYRVLPNDKTGILQYSPSGELITNDWLDLVTGVADLQVAMRVYQPTSTTDVDTDGDTKRNWYSSENMDNSQLLLNGSDLLQMRLALVTKATSTVNYGTSELPTLYNSSRPVAYNDQSDETPTMLQTKLVDRTSPYYGSNLFRYATMVVDLRNMGHGF